MEEHDDDLARLCDEHGVDPEVAAAVRYACGGGGALDALSAAGEKALVRAGVPAAVARRMLAAAAATLAASAEADAEAEEEGNEEEAAPAEEAEADDLAALVADLSPAVYEKLKDAAGGTSFAHLAMLGDKGIQRSGVSMLQARKLFKESVAGAKAAELRKAETRARDPPLARASGGGGGGSGSGRAGGGRRHSSEDSAASDSSAAGEDALAAMMGD